MNKEQAVQIMRAVQESYVGTRQQHVIVDQAINYLASLNEKEADNDEGAEIKKPNKKDDTG